MRTSLDRRAVLTAMAAAALSACGGGGDAPPPVASAPSPSPAPQLPAASPEVAVKWSNLVTNAMLADTAAQPPGLSPMEQSRILAMAFLAGHDAVNNIWRAYRPYAFNGLYNCQPTYTYEIAVCRVLSALLPSHAIEFNQVLGASLTAGNISAYGDEFELGESCASAILALRADDGSANAQGPYTPGSASGDYQLTPPVNVATFVNWGAVRPFAMTSGTQFRAPAPYTVAEPAYAADYDETRLLGAAVGSTRTADQSEIAKFWLESTPLSWQRIAADQVRLAISPSLWGTARLFALLQMSQADAYIASLESKYHHNFWRPITAIHAAATDGNPSTVADANWAPFDPVTPPVPEYPSAHAAAGAAGAGIMAVHGGRRSTVAYLSSTGSASRSYAEYFPEELYPMIATEIGLSRIYVGYHFRRAVERGWAQGYDVAQWVLDHALPKA